MPYAHVDTFTVYPYLCGHVANQFLPVSTVQSPACTNTYAADILLTTVSVVSLRARSQLVLMILMMSTSVSCVST